MGHPSLKSMRLDAGGIPALAFVTFMGKTTTKTR